MNHWHSGQQLIRSGAMRCETPWALRLGREPPRHGSRTSPRCHRRQTLQACCPSISVALISRFFRYCATNICRRQPQPFACPPTTALCAQMTLGLPPLLLSRTLVMNRTLECLISHGVTPMLSHATHATHRDTWQALGTWAYDVVITRGYAARFHGDAPLALLPLSDALNHEVGWGCTCPSATRGGSGHGPIVGLKLLLVDTHVLHAALPDSTVPGASQP